MRHACCSRRLAARHHADLSPSKTGRLQPWAFIILMIPLVGASPTSWSSWCRNGLEDPGAQQARKRIAGKLDPEKAYRELSDRLAASDTIARRHALAAECLNVRRFDEAERHYDHILTLPIGREPIYALGKAQAEFGLNRFADTLATLDDLKQQWSGFRICPRDICSMLARWGSFLSCVLSRRGGPRSLRHAAAHDGPQRRGESSLQ